MANVATFGGQCGTWGNVCNLWSECISEVVEILEGGARNPQEWGDHPFDNYEDQQKELLDFQKKNPQKRSVLIDILIKCTNKKYKKTIELPTKNVFIKVEDVNFIVNTLNEAGVDIKNIKQYNDDDLNNLLS